ncbi:MAG TPA: HD domain-containing phosphohydrolase [Polyangiaceae bacterium]|nr:HD domain-containing phosphohydrolase [Polyangiaceae bacterium]
MLSDEQFDSALLAVANFVDLKSPHTLGHSNAVSELCGAAGEALGLPPSDVRTLRRAGLVQGFGRLGVSNAIWDKPGPLGAGERERVRMHPYFTERMLHAYQAMRDRVLIARLGRLTRRRRLCAPRFALGVWTVTRWKRSSVQPSPCAATEGGAGRAHGP